VAIQEGDHPRALKRSMRVVGALLLTLSAVTPASSVFVIVPGVIAQAGTGAFISMAVAALLAVPIAYVYAELSSAFPIAGGEYSLVGRGLGPASGFAILGLTAFGNMLAPAVLSLGASTYLAAVLPGLDPIAVAIVIIVTTTVAGILHIRTNAWVTGVFLLLELLALAALAALGFIHVSRPVTDLILHPVMLANHTLRATPLAMIGVGTSVAAFAYNGYGAAVYFAEEMHEAPKLVARTILWALVITVATEFIPITAVLLGAPDLKAFLGSNSPFSDFVLTYGGSWFNIAISLSIALAIINAVLATVLQNGRFFFSTGRDNCWHPSINDHLTRTHSRFHSPWVGTLLAGGLAIIACFVGYQRLLVLTGAGIWVTYLALSIAALWGRWRGRSTHAAYRMPLFPLMPIAALIVLVGVLYLSWTDPDGRMGLIATLAAMALSLAYYFLFVRRRGVWVLRDPDDMG
jgi:amino acid transporter